MASKGRCVFCLAKRVHDEVGFEEASKLGYLKEHKAACPWVRGKGYVDLPKPRPRRRPTDSERLTWLLKGEFSPLPPEFKEGGHRPPDARGGQEVSAPDLRAEVLAGLDTKIKHVTALDVCDCREYPPTKDALTALRHLREIVERHKDSGAVRSRADRIGLHDWDDTHRCVACRTTYPCPTLLSLAPDYAPQALREIGK